MVRHSFIAMMLGSTLCWASILPVRAEQSDRQELFVDARNKIGVLRYCRDKGHVGQITADFAIEAIEAGPGRIADGDRSVRERGARLEDLGEAGFWGLNGNEDLASVAEAFDTTLGALCKELAATAMKLRPVPVSNHAVTVRPAPAPLPVPVETPSARPNLPDTRQTSAIQPVSRPLAPAQTVQAQPVAAPVKTQQAAAPVPPAPRDWIDESLEVNKWRFDRKARPWGWD